MEKRDEKAGDPITELREIEKLSTENKEKVVITLTVDCGGYLTIVCCS